MKKKLLKLGLAIATVMILSITCVAADGVVYLDGTVGSSGDGTTTETAVKTFDEAFAGLPNDGGTMYQGKIFYSYGTGGQAETTKSAIRVFDIAEKEIVGKIDLSDSSFSEDELECCCIFNGHLCVSTNTVPGKIWLFTYVESVYKTVAGATCVAEGVEHTIDCLAGDVIRTRSVEIDSENHTGNAELRGAIEATQETEGYTGDLCCTDCGTVIEVGRVIEKIS